MWIIEKRKRPFAAFLNKKKGGGEGHALFVLYAQ